MEAAPPTDELFTQISVGEETACGIRETGEVRCWCDPGPAGDELLAFCEDEPYGQFTNVQVGSAEACAQDTDGVLHCFGNYDDRPEIPSAPVASFDVANNAGCAIQPDGALDCWDPPPMGDPQPLEFPDLPWVSVAIGASWVCALDLAGDMYCSGPTWEHGANDTDWVPSPELVTGPFVDLDSHYLTTCGLRADGHPECWWGTPDYAVPGAVPDEAFSQIGLGNSGGCGVLLEDSRVLCWGATPEVLAVPAIE